MFVFYIFPFCIRILLMQVCKNRSSAKIRGFCRTLKDGKGRLLVAETVLRKC